MQAAGALRIQGAVVREPDRVHIDHERAAAFGEDRALVIETARIRAELAGAADGRVRADRRERVVVHDPVVRVTTHDDRRVAADRLRTAESQIRQCTGAGERPRTVQGQAVQDRVADAVRGEHVTIDRDGIERRAAEIRFDPGAEVDRTAVDPRAAVDEQRGAGIDVDRGVVREHGGAGDVQAAGALRIQGAVVREPDRVHIDHERAAAFGEDRALVIETARIRAELAGAADGRVRADRRERVVVHDPVARVITHDDRCVTADRLRTG